jgi:LPXTG-motif cell wall-anchored protein
MLVLGYSVTINNISFLIAGVLLVVPLSLLFRRAKRREQQLEKCIAEQ